MTVDDTERDLRRLLERRALEVDEHTVTGETVRRHLARRNPVSRYGAGQRRAGRWAPLATAAAILAVVAGVTTAVVTDTDARPSPATSSHPTTVTTPSDGSVPTCPAVIYLPGSTNAVCSVGTPPDVPPGAVVIRTPTTP